MRLSWSARSASALVWSVASRVHSPSIDSIKLVRKGRVRRAKLYYLRALRGKAARIAERRDNSAK